MSLKIKLFIYTVERGILRFLGHKVMLLDSNTQPLLFSSECLFKHSSSN